MKVKECGAVANGAQMVGTGAHPTGPCDSPRLKPDVEAVSQRGLRDGIERTIDNRLS